MVQGGRQGRLVRSSKGCSARCKAHQSARPGSLGEEVDAHPHRNLLGRARVECGHLVRSHVRDLSRLAVTHERVVPNVGDALDTDSVRAAFAGSEAVFSTLKVGRSPASPRAELLPPVDLVPRSVEPMVDAMRAEGVNRIPRDCPSRVSVPGARAMHAHD
ncbi:MAG: hypothetical protein EP330_18845 [Deltaproteobacteria bacterium]|nr:MAG: hypothetical protein EP330_18845 [Deltaproteobacteria bacterium]